MNDERIVEVMVDRLKHEFDTWFKYSLDEESAVTLCEDLVAALRDAGFDIYRPDDCRSMSILPGSRLGGYVKETGRYRLVPVGGDS